MSYPTQEDELRAKEASAQNRERTEESNFLSAFQSMPKRNAERLRQLSHQVVDTFNTIMDDARQKPFERQEDMMAGMKRLFQEQINVIEARRTYAIKINPATADRDNA
jgi:hypothetical protein